MAYKLLLGGGGDLVSKVISRVIIGVTPFRVLITLHITYLLGLLPLQAPIGPIVVPFWGSYLEFYKVIPKRNYYRADWYSR